MHGYSVAVAQMRNIIRWIECKWLKSEKQNARKQYKSDADQKNFMLE